MAATPRVVAELGRPETPQETADRRAAASRERRINQTAVNLVIALGATLLVVAFLVVVVVRPDAAPQRADVDWRADAVAAEQSGIGTVLSPELPDGWTANRTAIEVIDDTPTWTIGFLTPSGAYLALEQGVDATGAWVRTAAAVADDDVLFEAPQALVGGTTWWVLDRRDDRDAPGNHPLVLATIAGTATVVLHGTASDEEFAVLADALRDQLTALAEPAGDEATEEDNG